MTRFPFLIYRSVWAKFVLTLSGIILYALIFVPMYAVRGAAAASLSSLPIMVISWFFGLRVGVIAALLAFPLNALLIQLAGGEGLTIILRQGGPGSLALILVSAIVGRLSDLGKKLEYELTERHRVDKSLRESETKYRLIVETALDAVISMDADGVITAWNPQAEMIFGWSCSEALGQLLAHMIIPPQYREAHRRGLEHFLKTGQSVMLNKRFEMTALHRNNFEFSIELTITPMQIDGRFIFNAFVRDTSQLKAAQEKLISSQKRLQLLIEQTPALLWTTDLDLCFTTSQGAGLKSLKTTHNQIVGTTLFEHYRTDDKDFPPIAAHFQALQGHSVSYEVTWEDAVYQSYLEPLCEAEGTIIGCIGIAFDITDRRQSEAHQLQLVLERERLKLLEELISDLSHDLKTPLSVITTSLYLLENLRDPEKQKNKIDVMRVQIDRLNKLLQDILTSAKFDRMHELTFQPLNFKELIQALERDFVLKAEAKHITLITEQCVDELITLANEVSIHRALVNLIENALIYTPDGGRVIIRSYVQDTKIVIEVQDTGIGIDTADLPYIFDRFYRADKARSTQTSGTGLGLAITRKIIELHSGTIEVKSQPGTGTTFKVSFPLKCV